MKLKLLTLVATLIIILVGCEKKSQVVETPPPEVDVIPATVGNIMQTTETIAEIIALDEVDLVARVEGFLTKRHFKEGDNVKKGQLLFEIEPEIYIAKVKSAEAELEQAKATQSNANIDYERQKTLYAQKAVAERIYDTAKATKLSADARVKNAEAALSLAKQNLSYTKIYAPFDGHVGLAPISVGNLVNLSSGSLATVVSSGPVRAQFNIPEVTLLWLSDHIEDGDENINVNLFLPDGSKFDEQGSISFWDNKVNKTSGTFKVQATFKNKKGQVVPGMFSRVSVGPKKPLEGILLPRIAVMSDQSGDYVYVIGKDGKVVRKDLKLGFFDAKHVLIKSGLEANDKVVVNGIQKVRPGAAAKGVVDEKLLSEINATKKLSATKDKKVVSEAK